MDRRNFMAAAVGAGVTSASKAAAGTSAPRRFASGAVWTGAGAIAGGKGYAECPLGQMHYRDVGPAGRPPLLLIHQTPQFMVEFADIQPRLAASGRRSIAVDNPGFGLSDPAPDGVTIPDLADNMVALLEHLQVKTAIVAGHHTGAAIAAAFAARHPDRTAAVVLHGTPLYTPLERAERLARLPADLRLLPDGREFSDLFAAIYKVMGERPADLATAAWATVGEFLAGPSTPTYRAVFSYDLQADILAIRAPALILSDSGDTLHDQDQRAARLRPDFRYEVFSDGGSPALTEHPERWADRVLAFAQARRV